MKYGTILDRAARMTFKHKALWPFGVALAICGGASGGVGNGGTGLQYTLDNGDVARLNRIFMGDWQNILAMAFAAMAVLAIVGLVAALVSLIVRNTSRGALIGMAAEAQRTGETSFRSGLQQGWQTIVPLFLVSLVIGLVSFLLALVFAVVFAVLGLLTIVPGVAMVSAEGAWVALGVIWMIILGAAWVILLIALSIVACGALSMTKEYAYRAIVLDDRGVMEAIREGYALLKGHVKETAWMWIVLGVIEMALGLVLAPVAISAGAGILIPAILAWRTTESAALTMLAGVPALLISVAAIGALMGIYETFRSVSWTLVFGELQGDEA
ncbi:MAG: hypothetical protein GXX94_10080 [Chloroflexi bacterium]|nr:hypothetical protein [Chloroflexota bacterium]